MRDLQVIDAVAEEIPSAMCDHAAERAVLAAVLLDKTPETFRRVAAVVGEEDFYSPAHAVVWAAIATLVERGTDVDVYTLVAELRRRNRLHTVGGPQAIGELTDDVVTTAHAVAHAGLVADASQRRRLAAVAVQIARAAMDPAREPMRTRDAGLESLRAVRGRGVQVVDAASAVDGVWARIEARTEARERGDAGDLVRFGFAPLDAMSHGGMILGGTYVLAGREGTGKTTAACQIAAGVAERGEGVLYVALEGSAAMIADTFMSYRSGVELTRITRDTHTITHADRDALVAASNAIASWPLHILSGARCPATVAGIEAAARDLSAPPRLIVVDHLLRMDASRAGLKEHERVEEIMPALVKMGERLGVTVLVIAHIGRGELRGGLYARPVAGMLAGGRTIEREAYGVFLLHREDKHPTLRENVGSALVRGVVEVLASKLRGVGDCLYERLRFRGEVQRFEPLPKPGRGGADEDFPDPPPAYGDAE